MKKIGAIVLIIVGVLCLILGSNLAKFLGLGLVGGPAYWFWKGRKKAGKNQGISIRLEMDNGRLLPPIFFSNYEDLMLWYNNKTDWDRIKGIKVL